jgi:GTP-binding protein
MSRIVAIVGRPNVGKSTLFNRLTGTREAIEEHTAGVTRDRHYGRVEWSGEHFTLIDTGGYVHGSEDIFESEIRKQVKHAIDEADLILMVVDVVEGLTPFDESVATMLRKLKDKDRKVMLVVNKADNFSQELQSTETEFYSLGLGDMYPISAISGSGTGDLLDAMLKNLADKVDDVPQNDLPQIAVVGRPNVGKSSFINALFDFERHIVTDVAGTTRDAVDSRFTRFTYDLMLVDTAGLRKKSKVEQDIEFYSVLRTVKAIERCDVVMLILDATQGFESQDMNIFSLAADNHKGIVIIVNKWDLVEKDTKSADEYSKFIRQKLKPFDDVPIVFTSVLEKQRLLKVLDIIMKVYNNRKQKIATSKLNDTLLPIIEDYPPPALKSKYVKIKYITQLPIAFPAFAMFCSNPKYIREDYKRFLENKLREQHDFSGVPIEIYFREK